MKLQFTPWVTPNFVSMKMPPQPRQAGFRESPSFALKDLNAEQLADQCDRFRREVFNKAGKEDPLLAELKLIAGRENSDDDLRALVERLDQQ